MKIIHRVGIPWIRKLLLLLCLPAPNALKSSLLHRYLKTNNAVLIVALHPSVLNASIARQSSKEAGILPCASIVLKMRNISESPKFVSGAICWPLSTSLLFVLDVNTTVKSMAHPCLVRDASVIVLSTVKKKIQRSVAEFYVGVVCKRFGGGKATTKKI